MYVFIVDWQELFENGEDSNAFPSTIFVKTEKTGKILNKSPSKKSKETKAEEEEEKEERGKTLQTKFINRINTVL